MFEDLYRSVQRLIQSPNLPYVLAGLFILIWFVASRIVGLLRGSREPDAEPRPRRRLPLS